ncbi:MAG: hypothetical protein J5639_05090 [Bacteroidales bacterium]|nr:hypothetical protein [Bacteroidales bacterium]
MKRLLLSIIFVSIMLTACNVKVVDNYFSSLPNEVAKGKTILEISPGQRENVYIIDGYICSINERGMSEYVLEIRPLDDTTHIVNLIPYGTGADKMLLVDYSISGTKILVRDIVQHNYAIVDIHKVQENPSQTIDLMPYSLLTQELIPIENENIVYLNQGSFRSTEKRYYVIRQDEQPRKLSRNGRKSLNVLDGFFLYEPSRDRLAFLHMYAPEIEYYSFHNQTLLCKSSIEREDDVQIIEYNGDETARFLFMNYVPLCFVAGSSDPERIAAVYCDEQEHFHVLVFDWEGNIQGGFISEREVWSVSICNDYLYCWEKGEEQDKLVQYNMQDIQLNSLKQ